MNEAASRAREALAGLSPQTRETQRMLVIVAELLVEQCEQNGRLLELLEQGQTGSTTVNNNTGTAGTPTGAGRSAVPAPAAQPAPDGPAQEAPGMRLTEPDVPPVDDDVPGDAGGRPAPAKKTPAKKATAKKAATKTQEG